MAVRNDASPKRIKRSKQDSLMLRTNRSAWAFKFGDRGGSFTDSTPASAIIFKNSAVNRGSRFVNQVSLSRQDSLLRIREIARDLAHPQCIRATRDPRNLDLPRGEFHVKQNHKSLQPSPGPHFHGEKVRGHDQLPMLAQKLLPRRLPDPFRCRVDAVSFQDLRDRAAG